MEQLAEPYASAPRVSPELSAVFYIPDEARSSSSQMIRLVHYLEEATGRCFNDYESLHRFSVDNDRLFWRYLLHFLDDVEWRGETVPVCTSDEIERATFFPGIELSYAASLLGSTSAGDDAPALTSCYASGECRRITRGELRERVARLANALVKIGLRPEDRVVCVMRNDAQAVITALAVAAVGAVLSSAAPEMDKIHAADGAAFAQEAKSGHNPALRAFAAETVLIVKPHLGSLHALPLENV